MPANRIEVVKTDERREPAKQTSGMIREEAFAGDNAWAGYVRTEPNRPSGWHHHGKNDTYVYVLEGSLRMEFGKDGSDVVEAGPGDFLRVPPGVVHRESNPSSEEGQLIVVRYGGGPPTVNVDGPET